MNTSGWGRRLSRLLLVFLIIWTLAIGVIWLVGPTLLKGQLETRLQEPIGRPVHIDRIQIAPWSMKIHVEGIRVGAPPTASSAGSTADTAWPLRIDAIQVDADLLASLIYRAPVIDALAIKGLHLSVRHMGNGQWDVDDLLAQWVSAPRTAQAEPVRFSVFNITVDAPSLTLRDEPAGVTHRVESLRLDIPFLSNIGAQREAVTAPHLSFRLNDRVIEASARSTPFMPSQSTQLALSIPSLDVTPYLAYWPSVWPARLQSGLAALDLTVDFESRDTPQLSISGGVALTDVRIADTRSGADQPLLQWSSLRLEGIRVTPLQKQWGADAVTLDGLEVWLRRDASGTFNWTTLAPATSAPTSADPTTDAALTAATGAPTWMLKSLLLGNATVHWDDATTQPSARWTWAIDQAAAQNVQWPLVQPATFNGSAHWAGAPITWDGRWSPEQLAVTVNAESWPVATVGPYLRSFIRPDVHGRLSVRASLEASTQPERRWTLTTERVQLDDVRLGDPRQPLARVAAISWADARVGWPDKTVQLSTVRVQQPDGTVSRDTNGRWMVDMWRTAQPASPAAPSTTPDAWSVALDGLELAQGRLHWIDALPATPVDVRLDRLDVSVGAIQLPLNTPSKVSVTLAASVQADDSRGRIALKGVWQAPTAATLDVQATQLPVHALTPYAGSALRVDVLRAQANARGALALDWGTGLSVRYQGDVSVDQLAAETLAPREELMAWDSLQMRGIDLSMAPGAPLKLRIPETVLSDYFARVVIDEEGRLNLMHLWQPATSATASASAATGPPPQLVLGPISLLRGQLRFTDRFIRPQYAAHIQDLTGRLGGLTNLPASHGENALADLLLSGRVQGTASLDIRGQVNPLSSPPALDVRGSVRQLELPPLSPYSQRLTGYGIERGQLSMDVHYQVNAQGQLEASNQIILNRLELGLRDPDSRAPDLPIRLAVALLADRQGVIDVNLPISGSLNDPEFRLSAVVVRVIVNLISKAVTAPFSLIRGAFVGAQNDTSTVVFEPGASGWTPRGDDTLRQVAQLLKDRPAVSVTVVGHARADTESEAYRQAQLNALLAAEQRRQRIRQGLASSADTPLPQKGSPEYERLLTAVFRQSSVPQPRNLVGLLKEVPVADMETLLLAQAVVNEQALRDLAQMRAQRVKDALVAEGADPARVFLGAAQLNPSGSAPEQGPRAELRFGTQ